mgnify:CR=1 FL=1
MNKLLLILSCSAALLLAGAPAALAGPDRDCGHHKAAKAEKTAKAHPADCDCKACKHAKAHPADCDCKACKHAKAHSADCDCKDCKTAKAGCDCGGKAADCTDKKAADCPDKGSHADCPHAKTKSKAKSK